MSGLRDQQKEDEAPELIAVFVKAKQRINDVIPGRLQIAGLRVCPQQDNVLRRGNDLILQEGVFEGERIINSTRKTVFAYLSIPTITAAVCIERSLLS